MKKLLLITALVSFSFASAQITTNAGTFDRPTAGDTAFEMKFMPNLDGTAMFAESNSGTLMMRSFKSDTKATRISASLTIADSGAEDSDTSMIASVGYGIENHFSGAERLSTYWGYGGNVSVGSGEAGQDDEGNAVDAETSFGVGAGVFLGADYYIMPKVYVGVEMGYGLSISSGSDLMTYGLSGGVNGMMRVGFRL